MEWALRSGLYCARGLVERGEARDGLTFTLNVGDVTVDATIEDESTKLCLNRIMNEDGETDETIEPALRSLFSDRLGPEDGRALMDQVRDWIDSDSAGAYEPGAPNRRFLLLDELAQLPACRPDVLYRENDGLSRFVTVWTDGKVNVNAAPEPVLRSLFPHLDEDTLAALLQRRELRPLAELHELESITGTLLGGLPRKVTFFSNTFKVNLVGRADPALKKAEAVIGIIGDEEPRAHVLMWRTWWPREDQDAPPQ